MPDPGEPYPSPEWPVTGPNSRAGTPAAGVPETSTRRQLRTRLDAEISAARAELLRVDTKANSLLTLGGVLLGGAVAVLGGARTLPGAAAAVAWVAVAAVAAAVVLLACAVRPNLGGDFGFVRWARTASGQQLLDDLVDADRPVDPLLDRAHELRWLSCALLGKYVAVRRAVSLLVAGLAVAAAAAVAMWAR